MPIEFDSNDNIHPPNTIVKQENRSPLQQQSTQNRSKQRPIALPCRPRPYVKSKPQELPDQAQRQLQKESQFEKSISEICNLSHVISTFKRRFDELQSHLDFIANAIDARSNELSSASPQPTRTDTRAETGMAAATREVVATEKPELITVCERMEGRGLRKYIVSHLSDVPKLRKEVPLALKCAPKPATLVMDCIGRFYLQGSKAYTKDSPMVTGREASVLALEFLLLMMDGEIEPEKQLNAEVGAVAWRKRIIAEGGLSKAQEIDARGLLLFIGCYGIPKVFSNEDIWNLVCLSKSKQIAEALRRSHFLVARVSDIIEKMMKNGMKIEAVDVAQTFGIDKKFSPQNLLTAFLQESEETMNRRGRKTNISPTVLKEANEKHLAALKSVKKLLEDRKLDPTKTLPGWQLKEKLVKLEKDIADLRRRIDDKRKPYQDEFLNTQEVKRQRYTISPPSVMLHEQRAVSHVDGYSLYNDSVRVNLLDGEFPAHINSYPAAPSAPYGSSAGSLCENVLDKVTGGRGVIHAAGVGISDVYGDASTGSFIRGCRNLPVDRDGPMMSYTGLPYGHVVGNAAFNERQELSYVRQSGPGLYGLLPWTEHIAGLRNSPTNVAANHSTAYDMYRYVDSVVEGEHGSATPKAVQAPPNVGPYHSSYMY